MGSSSVLLAEDRHPDIRLARRVFARARLKAPLQVVTDGEQAIRYLSGEQPFRDRLHYPQPVVLFLDLDLPGRDGHEVLRWLRGRPELGEESLKVVILSSSDAETDRLRAAQAGASHYLVKPLSEAILLEVLHDLGLAYLVEASPVCP